MDVSWDKVIDAVYTEREKMQNCLSSVWRPPSTTYVQLNRTATESHKNKWCRTDERETRHHTDGRNGQSSMLDREGRLQCGRHWVPDSRIHDSRTLIRTNCFTFTTYLFQNTDAKRTRWGREEDQRSQFVKAYDSSDAKSNTQLDPRALRRKICARRGPTLTCLTLESRPTQSNGDCCTRVRFQFNRPSYKVTTLGSWGLWCSV